MTTLAFLIFTGAQNAATLADNDATEYQVIPRIIDNPLSAQLGIPGVEVGAYVAPAVVLNSPGYIDYWPSRLSSLPIVVLDDDTLFIPPSY